MRHGLLIALVVSTLTACPSSKTKTPDPEPKEATKKTEGKQETPKPACAVEDENCRAKNLGDAKIGWWDGKQTSAEIVAKLGEPDKKSARFEEGATGEFIESWEWSAQGIMLTMTAPNMTDPITTSRDISVNAPFAGKTDRDIGLGSTEEEVRAAYSASLDPSSRPGEMVIAGSVYGGIFFTITGGKVSKIFIGAGAE